MKRYSSGMQVRLAFAVAAHLEPDILVVDEVLAVGDMGFQKKCLGKMRDVSSEEGRTVLFVSHNTGALASLCTRGIVLEAGSVEADTDIHTALSLYVKSSSHKRMSRYDKLKKPTIDRVTIDDAALQNGTIEVRISFVSPFDLDPPIGGVVITDAHGTPILGTNARMHPEGFERHRARSGVLVCRIPRLPLHSGEYGISAWLGDMHQDYDAEQGILWFHFASPQFRPEIPPVAAIGPLNVTAFWHLEGRADGVPTLHAAVPARTGI
jgi:lipopolysaccharide transport system ATP-binding protein